MQSGPELDISEETCRKDALEQLSAVFSASGKELNGKAGAFQGLAGKYIRHLKATLDIYREQNTLTAYLPGDHRMASDGTAIITTIPDYEQCKKEAAELLVSFSQQARTQLINLLAQNINPYLRRFGAWLLLVAETELIKIACAGVFTRPHEIAPKDAGYNISLGKESSASLKELIRSLQGIGITVYEEKQALKDRLPVELDTNAILDKLRTDEHYPDFIREVPPAMGKAAKSLYSEFKSLLPEKRLESDRLITASEEDRQETEAFVLKLCGLFYQLKTAVLKITGECAGSALETICIDLSIKSVIKALLLNFLERRFPGLFISPSYEDEEDLTGAESSEDENFAGQEEEALAESWGILIKIMQQAEQKFKQHPENHAQKIFGNAVIPDLTEIIKQVDANICDAAVYKNRFETGPDECQPSERLKMQQAVEIVKNGEDDGAVYEVISTECLPALGYGICAYHAVHSKNDAGEYDIDFFCNAWAQEPNGPAVLDRNSYLTPDDVLGAQHPYSAMSRHVFAMGNRVLAEACREQKNRSADWFNEADGIPVRFIGYLDEETEKYECVNIYTAGEAEVLEKQNNGLRLEPLVDHQDLLEALRATSYRVPGNKGETIPLEELKVLKISSGTNGGGGDDETDCPVSPSEQGSSSTKKRKRKKSPFTRKQKTSRTQQVSTAV